MTGAASIAKNQTTTSADSAKSPSPDTTLADQNHSKYDEAACHCHSSRSSEDSMQEHQEDQERLERLKPMWTEIYGEVRRRLSGYPKDKQHDCLHDIILWMMNRVEERLGDFQFAGIDEKNTTKIELFLRIIRGEDFYKIRNTKAYFTTVINKLISKWMTTETKWTYQLEQGFDDICDNLPDTNDEHEHIEEEIALEEMVRTFLNTYPILIHKAIAEQIMSGQSVANSCRIVKEENNLPQTEDAIRIYFIRRVRRFFINRFGEDAVKDLFQKSKTKKRGNRKQNKNKQK